MKNIVTRDRIVAGMKRFAQAVGKALRALPVVLGVGIVVAGSVFGYYVATEGLADGIGIGTVSGRVVGVEKGVHRDEVSVVVDDSDQRLTFAIRHTDDKLRAQIWDSYGDRVRVVYSRAIVPSLYTARTKTALEVKSLWWWQS